MQRRGVALKKTAADPPFTTCEDVIEGYHITYRLRVHTLECDDDRD